MASCLSLVKLPSPTVAVSKASIIAPLMVSRDGPATMLNLAMNLSEFAININSTGSGPQMSHLNATVCRVSDVAAGSAPVASNAEVVSPEIVRAACRLPSDSKVVYGRMNQAGL